MGGSPEFRFAIVVRFGSRPTVGKCSDTQAAVTHPRCQRPKTHIFIAGFANVYGDTPGAANSSRPQIRKAAHARGAAAEIAEEKKKDGRLLCTTRGEPLRRLLRAAQRSTNPKDVLYVLKVSADQLQPAISVVVPPDRNFLHRVAELQSHRQDLHVEHIAVYLLTAKDLNGRILLEELKAALRIANSRQSDDGVHKHREAFGPETAMPRLAAFDLRFGKSP